MRKAKRYVNLYLEVWTMFFWLDVVTWIITKGKKKMDESCVPNCAGTCEQPDEDSYTFYMADRDGKFHAIEKAFVPMGLPFHDALAAYVQEISGFRFSRGVGRYMVVSANRHSAEVFDVTVPNKFAVTLVRGPVQG